MRASTLAIVALLATSCTPFAEYDPIEPEPKAQPPEMGPLDSTPDVHSDATPDTPPPLMDATEDVREMTPLPVPVDVTTGPDGEPVLAWETPDGARTTEVCTDGMCVVVEGTTWRDGDAPWPLITPESTITTTGTPEYISLFADPVFGPQMRTYQVLHKDAEGALVATSPEVGAARQVTAWRYAWERSATESGDAWTSLGERSQWGSTILDRDAPEDGSDVWYRVGYKPQGAEEPYAYTTAIVGQRRGVQEMALGSNHTCARLVSGDVTCWGRGSSGQLGDGASDRLTPGPYLAVGSRSLAAGENHTCSLDVQGALKCWGANNHGQLGVGGMSNETAPVSVATGVSSIGLGKSHTCALLNDGKVTCWGAGGVGELGGGSTDSRDRPDAGWTPPSSLTDIRAGEQFACGLTTGRQVVCWGYNGSSEIGQSSGSYFDTPQSVSGVSGVTQLALGSAHVCFVASGQARCWGDNLSGQLGYDSTNHPMLPQSTSVAVPGTVRHVVAGSAHSCALNTQGDVYCWGANNYGQLGLGDDAFRLAPSSKVPLPGRASQIYAGSWHTCAVDVQGNVHCWGRNQAGQIGNGATGSDQHVGDDPGETPARVTIP